MKVYLKEIFSKQFKEKSVFEGTFASSKAKFNLKAKHDHLRTFIRSSRLSFPLFLFFFFIIFYAQ